MFQDVPPKPDRPPAGGSEVTPPEQTAVFVPPIERTPFNSTPTTAPVAVPDGAGRIETTLIADLAMLQAQRGSPVAETLAAMALTLARHADAADGPVREQIATMKELRALLDDITKEAGGGATHDPDDATPDSPFGPVRPELVNT